MNTLAVTPGSVLAGRFEMRRHLGDGAFGTVYEVWDRQRGQYVALKTLHLPSADALYQFKREFRSLADLSHPNLVTLHELASIGDHWFFTMELVDGVDFRDYLQSRTIGMIDEAEVGGAESSLVPAAKPAAPLLPPLPDPTLIRWLFSQLARGVSALHDAGKLHRDIKPSNVLVTPERRLVLLDFGLVAELADERMYETQQLVGTPAFMSPEQAGRKPVTPASDWYSVGVMLFEALTGRLPFDGPAHEVLARKQLEDPPHPAQFVRGLPADLGLLAAELLSREPAVRPDGREVLRRLGRGNDPRRRPPSASTGKPGTIFVGREEPLRKLEETLSRTVRTQRAALVLVHGPSGIGKTALARRFTERIEETFAEAILLSGRCFERESVPYKAVDSLVDALTQHLRKLLAAEVEAILPRDLSALLRIFPVLRRVEAAKPNRSRSGSIAIDPTEIRRRGFAALKEMFRKLAMRRPMVLWIDDLQWGDEESEVLLGELMAPPDPPPILLLACCRDEAGVVESLTQRLGSAAASNLVDLPLPRLSAAEARQLAEELAAREGDADAGQAATIASEAGGNPYYIDQLVRHHHDDRHPGTLADLIRGRIQRLPEPARRLLDAVAVAGRPIELGFAARAAEVENEMLEALDRLRSERLVRGRGNRVRDPVEAYHDRVRETVIDELGVERIRTLHGRLADVLEESGRADAETLTDHFLAAENFEKAAAHARQAALRAEAALAFERAARLYRVALELGTPGEAAELRLRLADALALAGRGPEAARAYLSAAELARPAEAIELKRRAAEQWLRSGHIDAGLDVLRDVLGPMGFRLPESPGEALLSLLRQRFRLWLRGTSWLERDPIELAPAQLLRIDACWSVATGLGLVDNIRAAEFQARHLRLALDAGEPYRVGRALGCEVGYSAVGGTRTRARTAAVLARARAAVDASRHPHAIGILLLTRGLVSFLEGRWRDAMQIGDEAEAWLREQWQGAGWELATIQIYTLESLLFLGEVEALAERIDVGRREAAGKGDRYALAILEARFLPALKLIQNDPEAAHKSCDQAMAAWSARAFHLQHFWRLLAHGEAFAYQGQGTAAVARYDAEWRDLERSQLLRIQQTALLSFWPRGRALLLAADQVQGEGRRRLLARAAQDARRIRRQRSGWADGFADLIDAGIAARSGATSAAQALAARAGAALAAHDMPMVRSAALHLEARLAGDAGRLAAARDELRRFGVVEPDRFATMMAP